MVFSRLGTAIVLGCLVLLMPACTTTSRVLREAPKQGVEVQGVNVLFMIMPPTAVTRYAAGVTPLTGAPSASDLSAPRPEAERLRNEVRAALPRQLEKRGIRTNFAALDVMPGVAPTPIEELFPKEARHWHTLVIVPVREATETSPQKVTRFTVSMSLRSAKDNSELWNMQIGQGLTTLANLFPNKNDKLIDDMVEALVGVLKKTTVQVPKGQVKS